MFHGKTDQEVIEIVRSLHDPELLLTGGTTDVIAGRTLTDVRGDKFTAMVDVAEDGTLRNGRIFDWRGNDVTHSLKI